MTSIKNIIFDFGNVLFDLASGSISAHFQSYLGDKALEMRAQLNRDNVFNRYETGHLSTTEFVTAIRQASGEMLTEEQVHTAWNSILLGMPAERFELLRRLRGRYRVFLLSNINDLHATWIEAYMAREHRLPDFLTRYFDKVYYSHEVNMRKPDPAIFQHVLSGAGLVAGETVFIDDLEENVEAARSVGMQGIVKRPEVDILELMDPYLKG